MQYTVTRVSLEPPEGMNKVLVFYEKLSIYQRLGLLSSTSDGLDVLTGTRLTIIEKEDGMIELRAQLPKHCARAGIPIIAYNGNATRAQMGEGLCLWIFKKDDWLYSLKSYLE